MTRFGPDPQAFFDGIYQDVAPWDVGRAQPALTELLEEHPPHGPVLDLGCGTGDLAIHIARQGLEVLGVDTAATAIAEARRRADDLPPEVAARLEFRVGDALHPSRLGRSFGAIVDSGFLHLFEAEQRDLLARELALALVPGGRYYLLAFAVEFPIPNTPLRVTEEEIRSRFTVEAGWQLLAARPAEFLSRLEPVPAIAACVEKLGAAG